MKQANIINRSAKLLSYIGYSLSLIQLSLLLTFITVVILNHTTILFDNTPQNTNMVELTILNPYPSVVTSTPLAVEQKVPLIVSAIAIGLFSAAFIGKHSSNILKRILGRLYKKPTASSLFFAKILIITISFLFIVILLLALPTFATLLPVIAGGSVAAIVCFSIQHFMARRGKMPYKKIA